VDWLRRFRNLGLSAAIGAAHEQFDRAAVIVVARLLKNPCWPDP
jgi:hypothetical protein